MAQRRVVVTGLGLVTPLGVGVKTVWNNLIKSHCGIVSLADREGFKNLPVTIAAEVPKGVFEEGKFTASEWLDRGDDRIMAKFTQYAIAAAKQAIDDAEWTPKTLEEKERTGVCVGSGMGSLEDIVDTSTVFSKGGYRKVSPMFVPRILSNMAAGHITMKYGYQGPNHAVSTACTTGAHAIGDAARFIQFGDADVMIAGGTEASIHPLSIAGFARAKSLSDRNEDPSQASRPFDRHRNGFVMGEGAGIVVLEEYEHAKKRGATIYAEVKGYGVSGDAHHMTSPPENGAGAVLSMQRALRKAGLTPGDIDYVNAHATSTPAGDRAENRAIKTVFDGYWDKICVSSTKGATGHLLGAAGAVEAIFTILAVNKNIIPPTINLENPGFNEAGSEEFNLNYVPLVAQERKVKAAITNSFGFGGTNATLCFAKV